MVYSAFLRNKVMKGNPMKILIILLMVSISGCASMLNGTEQDLTIKTMIKQRFL